MSRGDPHAGGRVAAAGAPLARARLAVVMAHGRGGAPEDMLALAERLALPDVAYLAPEAPGRSWWPRSFLEPLAGNEPWLSSALAAFGRATDGLAAEGFGPARVVLMGFSQGACLALEFAARRGGAWRGVFGLSGGLLGAGEAGGPPRDDLYGRSEKRFDYPNRLDGASVFLGCHARDPHIPLARVRESERTFRQLGAEVEVELHAGAGHGVVASELRRLRAALNLFD